MKKDGCFHPSVGSDLIQIDVPVIEIDTLVLLEVIGDADGVDDVSSGGQIVVIVLDTLTDSLPAAEADQGNDHQTGSVDDDLRIQHRFEDLMFLPAEGGCLVDLTEDHVSGGKHDRETDNFVILKSFDNEIIRVDLVVDRGVGIKIVAFFVEGIVGDVSRHFQ